MSEDQKQTVVEDAEVSAQQDTQADNAQDNGDDLDSLLNEFDKKASREEAKSVSEPKAEAADSNLVAEVRQMREQFAALQLKQEIGPVIEKIRGDLPKEVFDDDEILDWLDGRAKRDTRLRQAWANCASNPAAWNKIVGTLGKKFSEKFKGLPDKSATEDREAVTHAVRGASTKAPDSGGVPDFSKMLDGEAREAMRKMGIEPQF